MRKLLGLSLLLISIKLSFSHDDVQCGNQLNQFEAAIEDRESWALLMFDTWAKLPSGWLHGNLQNPGHFVECVKVRHEDIQGQHCMVTFTATSNETSSVDDESFNWRDVGTLVRENSLTLVNGICLPASCSVEKVIEYSNGILKQADLKPVSAICRTNDPVPFGALDIFAIVFFSLLLIALITSTIYEIFAIKKNRVPNKLLSSFSVYTNGAKLFDITKSKSPNVIHCLNGLKTLSILWIIFGHRFDDRWLVPVMNFNDSASFSESFLYLVYPNFEKPVDTFFLIGGLLTTWLLLRAFDTKTTNIPRMYLHRYLRYTPTLAVIILFYMAFNKHLGSGPFFDPNTVNCDNFWWTALLHVTVYTNAYSQCWEVAWYLAVDFQLFLISPILIYPLWRWGKKFFWVLPTLVVLVQGCIFATTYRREIMVSFYIITTPEGSQNYLEKWYFPTHLRLGAWVIGIMLGYKMYETRGTRVKINKIVEIVLWILSFSIILSILLSHYPFQQTIDNQTTRLQNSLYNTLFRIWWSYAVGWIIFACHNGSGGAVRWFLSLKEWQPLGRLGLSIYLVHRLYQLITLNSEKQPIYWDFFTQTQKFFGDVFVSLFLGTILYLGIENPVLLIESYLHKQIQSWRLKKSEK